MHQVIVVVILPGSGPADRDSTVRFDKVTYTHPCYGRRLVRHCGDGARVGCGALDAPETAVFFFALEARLEQALPTHPTNANAV